MPTRGSQTLFYTGDAVNYATSATWTKLATVLDIKPPKMERGDIETTNNDVTDDYKTFMSGSYIDPGEVEVKLQYDKVQQASLLALFESGANKGLKMTFSDGSTWGMTGFIKTFGDEITREKLVETTIMLKVSGKSVFTPAT